MPQKIILDTDIGDDIDDALALGLICGSPELELLGVTTVFGNVRARARQAQTVLHHAGKGFAAVPVAAGCGAALTSRPVWLDSGGTLETHLNALPSQDSTCLSESVLPPLHSAHGVDFLIDTIMAGDGDIIPVTIGAMTNLALALVKEPRLLQKIPRVVSMAAEFKGHFAEWNVLCDVEAAALVFRSGLPVTVTTWDIGNQCKFSPEHVAQLRESSRPMASNLSAAIKAWRPDESRMPSLFDPLAIATMIEPDLVKWKQGTVSVELIGRETFGFTTFREGDGPHRIAWLADREAALQFCLDRILSV